MEHWSIETRYPEVDRAPLILQGFLHQEHQGDVTDEEYAECVASGFDSDHRLRNGFQEIGGLVSKITDEKLEFHLRFTDNLALGSLDNDRVLTNAPELSGLRVQGAISESDCSLTRLELISANSFSSYLTGCVFFVDSKTNQLAIITFREGDFNHCGKPLSDLQRVMFSRFSNSFGAALGQ